MLQILSFFYFFFIIVDLVISKCPETRRPHPTNCNLFYNCVNLPSGEYVWTPSKCSEGLMFESYLGICVLPSETWTCDTNFREEQQIISEVKNYLNQSSDNLELSEALDSSYSLDTTFDKDINPLIPNFSKQNLSILTEDQTIDENTPDENLTESYNFTKSDRNMIVNNVVLLNYFITNYIIRNNEKNQNTRAIEIGKNETKYNANTGEKAKNDINQIINRFVINKSPTKNVYKSQNDNSETKNVCRTIGNIPDLTSIFHYYLCYSNNEKTKNLSSLRMMCPKNLIFCAEKKICTRQRICRKSVSSRDSVKNNE
ncbi:uncharacterized protein PF11_0213 [Leptopilina heterotoma]|uniref:uncharacterized protein PF11_0213 n=1 Tax=Leptopilina heterotoma TaxID=63436 RepID=UPI001CA8C5E1|nr:uncharacterized protein PF11_0213 [Leptopilina heterotoma]